MRRAAALTLIAFAGCGGSGEPTRLDGSKTDVGSMSVAEAQARTERILAYVRGHLVVPVDDVPRLCARIADGYCEGASIALANPHDDLRRLAAPVLEHGCCARPSWSPNPVVVHVWLRRDHKAHVVG